ncbi:hypothetical protein DPMN_059037 [Dreissena polymorpha]|uniref:Uncharacterized protein n=1 Tax=Dreissena polymorpha TaxID=45954 RepID=A0A9D4HGV2_DREPO|nr:hypothetical protein DPMN_059037 [Dreissena polymorpha]
MKFTCSAAQDARNRCVKRRKNKMTAQGVTEINVRLTDMYRIINGRLTDITMRVTYFYRIKRQCSALVPDKTFSERERNGKVPNINVQKTVILCHALFIF